MKKIEGYFGGGEYYCHKCKKPHHDFSEIGKKHIKYARPEIRRSLCVTSQFKISKIHLE